jgi:energy-coupling factor transport system permease protein
MYHTITWLLWLLAALLPAMLTRNPLYLIILLLAVAVDYNTIGRLSAVAGSWRLFLKAGLFLAAFSILFNTLTVHYGETVLFTLPRFTLTFGRVTFLDLGGNITLEALTYGLANGLSLIAILLIFATFNVLVDHHQLLRSIPAFMYQTAMIASIAIAFVPQMVSSLRDIREAQAIRGHRFRGVRDLLPLFIPLLTTGLERAIQLAESMEARGFGSNVGSGSRKRELAHRVLIVLSLFGLLAGAFWYSYYRANRGVGAVIVLVSILALAGNLIAMGRRVERSRYHRELWRRRDSIVSAASIISIATIASFWLVDGGALLFYPYPSFSLPSFNLIIGLALLTTIIPVLVAPQKRRRNHDPVPRRDLRLS